MPPPPKKRERQRKLMRLQNKVILQNSALVNKHEPALQTMRTCGKAVTLLTRAATIRRCHQDIVDALYSKTTQMCLCKEARGQSCLYHLPKLQSILMKKNTERTAKQLVCFFPLTLILRFILNGKPLQPNIR